MVDLIPPDWLVKGAVALVWIYEGLYCKLFRGDPRQFEIVRQVPKYGERFGTPFLITLGIVELLIGIWVLTYQQQVLCAILQTALLCILNLNGILWSKNLIHDPMGMVIKNIAFIILVWVAASLSSI